MTKLEESYTKAKDFIVDESLQVRTVIIRTFAGFCFLPCATAHSGILVVHANLRVFTCCI